VRATTGVAQDGHTWIHEESGLVAVSRSVPAQPEYELVLALADGRPCSGALALMALADFGMLQARPEPTANRLERRFRLPAAAARHTGAMDPDARNESATPATLHTVCGKIAAGKSTLAHTLARQPATIRVSEDEWLPRLYPGEIRELPDYVRCAERLRQAMGPHVEALLRSGVSVVLDFPSNTPATRAWARALADGAQAAHTLHWLDLPDSVCKARLRERNASGLHPYTTSEEQYDQITGRFVAPAADEGLHVVRYER
jgi:predicted kinase